jgi:hypothetical protein
MPHAGHCSVGLDGENTIIVWRAESARASLHPG